jgi:hypothetical protein
MLLVARTEWRAGTNLRGVFMVEFDNYSALWVD